MKLYGRKEKIQKKTINKNPVEQIKLNLVEQINLTPKKRKMLQRNKKEELYLQQ